jgi:protein-disulfide isomerase
MDLHEPVTRLDHVRGAERARITLVEYGDFECPYCAGAEPALRQLLALHPSTLRLVFRHFPLEGVHPHALLAAEASEAAGAQGRFWEMHDLLLARQSHLDAAHLREYAAELGLDLARFTAEMDDEVYRQRVREHIAGGNASGVRGTPGLFVNGQAFDVSGGIRPLFELVAKLDHGGGNA